MLRPTQRGAAEERQREAGQLDPRVMFALIYATSVSSLYFALGYVSGHAQGLTPAIFILAGVFFQLTSMTYAEGASLHPQRGGSPTFARYAFNELVGFISGWAILLDYILLIAVAALAVPSYLAVIWPALARGDARVIAAVVVILIVSVDVFRGAGAQGLRRQVLFSVVSLVVGVALIVGGLFVFHGSHLTATVHLGHTPSLSDLGFAIPLTVIAFTGIESASSLAVGAKTRPRELRRLIALASAAVVVVYVGTSAVGIGVLPVHHGLSALDEHKRAPVLAIAAALHPHVLAVVMKYIVGVTGALVLTAASGAGMLGVSRAGYSMATHRQIPSAVGRLSQRWGTPVVIIVIAALAAIGLVIPGKLTVLIDIYAFGALITFTIAHLSVVVMRFREPALDRDYRVPLSIPVRGAQVPLPAVLGAILSVAGWVMLVVFHPGARYVGLGWLLGGVLMYVSYRRISGRPVLQRLVIPERALRQSGRRAGFGSILVPIFGGEADDEAVAVAGQLAGDRKEDAGHVGTTIEAVYVIAVPTRMSLDGPLPEGQLEAARAALKHAREIGEAYEDVEVATAVVRSRRVSTGIVQEARRRGVEVIVLAVDLGDARAGAQGAAKVVGETAAYVIDKAPCPVILAAPAQHEELSVHG
ncbi:MAG TPA: amino acid permease [Solirubrobacteraceae bacterium]|nr:amino acid permease [Solirubrobacteraceae bacterium]